MGIDIFMKWDGGPSFDRDGFTGANGYLREAYHGGPYATVRLVPEAFGSREQVAQGFGVTCDFNDVARDAEGYALIPARVLRARLAQTLLTVAERYRTLYDEVCGEGHPALRAFIEFVELAERIEAERGRPVGIYASW